ncbi:MULTISPECIES: hypothetical protein [unclassified Variovorax]|uniref:hypothetical protein n=1 Tax=unclassified Variovorax TaxID=663243 RepID=UPI003F44B055
MASIISSLPVVDQAARLSEFIAARGTTLSDTAAQNVCRSVELHKLADSKLVARKLVAALAAHGVVIKYTNALEALARVCDQPNWMRTLQASLPFGDAELQHVVYGLQAVKDGGLYLAVETFPTMSEATDRLLKVVASEWPTTTAVSLCTLSFSSEMLFVELEHPTAPWLQFKLCRFVGTEAKAEMGVLPPTELRVFCERLTRALEYSHPGLMVLNSLRCMTLAPEYYLCPQVRQVNTGDQLTCWGDLELLPVLDSFRGTPEATAVDGVLRFDSDNGPIELTPGWMSNTDGDLVPGGLSVEQLNGLLKRLARLRRLTGLDATHHLGRIMTAAEDAENVLPFNKDALEGAMREVNLTPKQLALLAKLPLNVVQRALKYAYAHESVIPKLSDALGLAHPNALLPPEKSEGTGVRIQDGAVFLRALKQTHMWHRIMGESLRGEEADEVSRIGEALQEYVELLQFSTGPFGEQVKGLDTVAEPIEESALARDVQELLDELKEMGVAVVITNGIRYAHGSGRMQSIEGMPMHHGTMFFEKVVALKSPRSRRTVAP